MSHFAKVENGVVTEVIVAEQDFVDTLPNKDLWIQTSYNTHGGEHPEDRPLRKNFAGIGFTYDAELDAFIPPPPLYKRWVLNKERCLWEAPIPYPDDGRLYNWNDEDGTWDLRVL